MDLLLKTLSSCPLFSQLTPGELQAIARQLHSQTRAFSEGEIVAFEDDECSSLGIVVNGSMHIQRIYESGKLITIETFHAGDSFGEALVFSGEGRYPATLTAKEDTTVLFLQREEIIRLCEQYPRFLQTFLRTLSDRILLLNRKIKSLSYQSVRQKVAHYILEAQRSQKSDLVQVSGARHELADSLGIPRPSLSRELIAMKELGWIDFDRKTIRVLDRAALEQSLKS